MKLKDALFETYIDWKKDLEPGWLDVLSDTELAFDAVDSSLELEAWEPIFPARKGRRILGAPSDASTLSAFEKLTPNAVRVVLIGQDPYPNIAQATGRAFEQGDVKDWVQESHDVTKSMRRILQVVGDFRSGTKDYTTEDVPGWQRLIRDLKEKRLQIENRPELFSKWVNQGVLLLNAGLTISRFEKGGHPHQLKGHIPLWRPVIDSVMRFLAERQAEPVLFVLWGDEAMNVFRDSGIERVAKDADTWQKNVQFVYRRHPAYGKEVKDILFFQNENRFVEINAALTAMGAELINW